MSIVSLSDNSDVNAAYSTEKSVSLADVTNLYASAIAIEKTSGTTGSYPDFSVIAGIYADIEAEESDDNATIDSADSLQKLLKKIEEKVKETTKKEVDLFEFDEDGKNTNESVGTKTINDDGTLTDASCPKTGAKNCTCKVTDGFQDIDGLFDALSDPDKGTPSAAL